MQVPLRVHRRRPEDVRAEALEMLGKVGIADKAASYPAQLSGGQQQRVAIARALCINPRAMLFDEPTSALDPQMQREVVRVIELLAREGRTMLLVTHDMDLAQSIADHVIFLHEGRILEQGNSADIFGTAKADRLRQFLAAGRPA